MDNNIYRVTYKNGIVREYKALSMILKDGKLYQLCKAYLFDNPRPSVINGNHIATVECIERNNTIDYDVESEG